LQLKQADLRDIISGKYEGAYAVFARLAFCPFSLAYRCAVQIRNKFYDAGTLKIHKVSVPVISVGNITTGGTGKTPLVVWLVNHLAAKYKPAILTRGYKSNQGISDEASLLAQACPKIPVIINPDRVKGAKEAIAQGANVLVMDDGFQHRRLARDMDIVAIDATCPFGYGRILPAGLLREPLSSLKRADAVIITRADQIEKDRIDEIKETVKAIKPSLVVAAAVHKPLSLVDNHGTKLQLTQIKNKKVFAFCGIGNPQAFFDTLKSVGATIAGSCVYDDHYHYSKTDIDYIADHAKAKSADLVLTTEKDFNKINAAWLKNTPPEFAYLAVEIELRSGAERITQLIEKTIADKISKTS
jgi:tetraacyldisaccharide 4'-kinase